MSIGRADHIERMIKGTLIVFFVGIFMIVMIGVFAELLNDGYLSMRVVWYAISGTVGLILTVYLAGYAVTDLPDDIREVRNQ